MLAALAKYDRERASKEEVITELADVSIMMEQIGFLLGYEEFNAEKERKLERLGKRIKEYEERNSTNETISTEPKNTVEVNEDEIVILEAYSEAGDRDRYGDFVYYSNPLQHYKECNRCKVSYEYGSNHAIGYKRRVETTMSFIKEMGFEDDLKYRIYENNT